jgi:DNA topoisomerase IB
VTGPGYTRRRAGRGFAYLDTDGALIKDDRLDRIRGLAIPPAWRDVWICPWPNGHIQATGLDAAGRRQYRYHDAWRTRRDAEKHERVLEIARQLPDVRDAVKAGLRTRGLNRDRVLATAIRLLDLGAFRIGSEQYEEENGTYGLATLKRSHVSVRGERTFYSYTAKGGIEREVEITDRPTATVVQQLLERPADTGEDLLAYQTDDGEWRDVTSAEINAYLKEISGAEITAKDFRTWTATVLAAVAMASSFPQARSRTARARAITRAVKEVALYLGNTPAVCRASYIDPRVFDRYRSGLTIAGALDQLGQAGEAGEPAHQGPIEEAVLDLIEEKHGPAPELDLIA